MFFKGTEKMKKPRDVAEFLDKVGGSFNAFTGEEMTGFYAKTAYTDFDLAIDWVSDIFLNSKFPAEELEKERGVIIEELNMYHDNPMMYIDQVWKEVLYGDQPAGWDIGGNKETVSKITRKQIIDYIKDRYTSENILICIAGRYKESGVLRKLSGIFSSIPEGSKERSILTVENQSRPEAKLCYRKVDQTNLIVGVRAYDMFDEKRYTLNLISAFLGGMMSSRLFEKVREQMGAAYYIRTMNDSGLDVGNFAACAGVDNNKVFEVVKAILEEFKKLKEEPISKEELKKAKDYIKGKTLLGLENPESKVSFYGTQELLMDKVISPEEVLAKIDAITQEDIRAVAREVFVPEKLNLALIGPFKNKKEFEKILDI
jgi:predicted Zn-dependent peptidase